MLDDLALTTLDKLCLSSSNVLGASSLVCGKGPAVCFLLPCRVDKSGVTGWFIFAADLGLHISGEGSLVANHGLTFSPGGDAKRKEDNSGFKTA
jgi:hypothetical protein